MAPRPTRIVAIGWFGERNLGDDAMLEGLVALLGRAFGEAEITALSADPQATESAYGIRAARLPTPRDGIRAELALAPAMFRADLVTLGGGDLIRETRRNPAPATYWLARLRLAHLLRRPVAVLGISVGELRSPALREEVARGLRACRLVAVRDADSAGRLADLGVEARVMGDLALEAPLSGAIAPATSSAPRPPRIGLVPRAIDDRGPGQDVAAMEAARARLVAALDGVVASTGAEVHVIPFRVRARPGMSDDDAEAGEALASTAATGAAWRRQARPDSAADFASLVAGLDLVVSVRLHGLILAAAAGRPVVGIAYDPKVHGFLSEVGLPEQSIDAGATTADIRQAIERGLGGGDVAARTAAGIAALRARTHDLVPALRAAAGRAT